MPTPSRRSPRSFPGTLAASAVLVAAITLLAFVLSDRQGTRHPDTSTSRVAALPSSVAPWSAPPWSAPPPPAASPESDSPSSAFLSTAPAPTAPPTIESLPTSTTAPPPLSSQPPHNPPPHPSVPAPALTPAVTSLSVDQPTYHPDHTTTTFVIHLTTTTPTPVTVTLTSAASPWPGMLGWSHPAVRTLTLQGRTTYTVSVPYDARDYCGTSTGTKYWGALISTTPTAPGQAVYADLPTIC